MRRKSKTEGKATVICLAHGKGSGIQNASMDQLITIIEGEAEIIAGKEVMLLHKGDSTFIHSGTGYEVRNRSKDNLIYACIERKGETMGLGS